MPSGILHTFSSFIIFKTSLTYWNKAHTFIFQEDNTIPSNHVQKKKLDTYFSIVKSQIFLISTKTIRNLIIHFFMEIKDDNMNIS